MSARPIKGPTGNFGSSSTRPNTFAKGGKIVKKNGKSNGPKKKA